MSKFEYFCYLLAQRDKANRRRRYLLYLLNKKLKSYGSKRYTLWAHPYRAMKDANEELNTYRNFAEAMRNIAVGYYSPLRRELGIKVYYTGSNFQNGIKYQGETFSAEKVREIADGYIFDEVVIRETDNLHTPYESLLDDFADSI